MGREIRSEKRRRPPVELSSDSLLDSTRGHELSTGTSEVPVENSCGSQGGCYFKPCGGGGHGPAKCKLWWPGSIKVYISKD